jgi:hypothetical protein
MPTWWRAIQDAGSASDCKREKSNWTNICTVFGLPFLKPNWVSEYFPLDFCSISSQSSGFVAFSNYLLDTCIDVLQADFPPTTWEENSASSQRTTNAYEAFHAKFNALLYTPHPDIFQFVDVLQRCEVDSSIKITASSKILTKQRRLTKQNI